MKLALVVGRYGDAIVGGAEQHMRAMAERLVARGHEITVLSTCAIDHFTWKNVLPAGRSEVRGVCICRFPVTIPRDQGRVARLQLAIDQGIGLPPELEEEWVRNTGYSQPLLDAIDDIADSVDAIIFGPYLFAATVFGARRRPERSLIQPLLHDEAYARFACVQETMSAAAGILWISRGERLLGERILPGLPEGRLVGGGVDLPDRPMDGATERRRLRIGDAVTVAGYAGRREEAKNFPMVAEAVTAANLAWGREACLLAMGTGPARLPTSARPFVRDLGVVSGADKLAAFAASTAVVNLSLYESFSYVVMEAWSVCSPVIVHADCVVTRGHCEASGGGLWVRSVEEAVEALLRLQDEASLRRKLGAAGRAYVEREATWPPVMERLEAAVGELIPPRAGARA